MKVSLHVHVSEWRAPDFGVVLAGGRHDLPNDQVTKLPAGFIRQIAAAASAGVLEVVDCDASAAAVIDGAVESDEDSLKLYAAAVASGVWLDGHLQDVIAQRENQLAALQEQLTDESLEAAAAGDLLARAEYALHVRDQAKTRLAAHRGEM